MTLLGLDFDNTLVRYDNLFHQLALEKGLISQSVPPNKTLIRNHLRLLGKEKEFTLLQGEVYGCRILEASATSGLYNALKELKTKSVPMVIISHKTQKPYTGPAHDLHKSALGWLEKNNFFSTDGLNFSDNQVYFEPTKEKKISRIIDLGVTHYVDDLPEILEMIPSSISKYLFDPFRLHSECNLSSFHKWESFIELFEK